MNNHTCLNKNLQSEASKQFKGWEDQQMGVNQIMTTLYLQKKLPKFSQHMQLSKAQIFVKNQSKKFFKSKIVSLSKIRKESFSHLINNLNEKNKQDISYNKKQNNVVDKSKRRNKTLQRTQFSQTKVSHNIVKHDSKNIISKNNNQYQKNKNTDFYCMNKSNSYDRFKIHHKINQNQPKLFQNKINSKQIQHPNNIQKKYQKIINQKQLPQKMKNQILSAGHGIRKNIIDAIVLKGKQMGFQNKFKSQIIENINQKIIYPKKQKEKNVKKQDTNYNIYQPIKELKNFSFSFNKLKKNLSKYQFTNGKVIRKQNNNSILNKNSAFLFRDTQIFDQFFHRKNAN